MAHTGREQSELGRATLAVVILVLLLLGVGAFFLLGGDIDFNNDDNDNDEVPEVSVNPPDVSVGGGDAPDVSVGQNEDTGD